MKIKSNTFLGLYILLVLLDVIIGSLNVPEFRQFSKPLILISLVIYFAAIGKGPPLKIYVYTLTALCFSLLGDVLLLYDHISTSFFMFGLISFLIAHLCYSMAFFEQSNKRLKREFWSIAGILIAYGTALFCILKNNLGTLQIPVIIYILGILALAITAYMRKGKVNTTSFKLTFLGALFFIASDSILAINKFLINIPWSLGLVMGTYALAQYLLIKGLILGNDRMYKTNSL